MLTFETLLLSKEHVNRTSMSISGPMTLNQKEIPILELLYQMPVNRQMYCEEILRKEKDRSKTRILLQSNPAVSEKVTTT